MESVLYQIRRWPLTLIAPGCHDVSPAPADALQTLLAHQAGHALAADCHTLVAQFGPHPRHAVGLIRFSMNLPDAFSQNSIIHGACRR